MRSPLSSYSKLEAVPASPVGVGGQEDGCGNGSVDDERTGGGFSASGFLSSLTGLAASSSFSLGAGLGAAEALFPPETDEAEPDEADPRRARVHRRTLR